MDELVVGELVVWWCLVGRGFTKPGGCERGIGGEGALVHDGGGVDSR